MRASTLWFVVLNTTISVRFIEILLQRVCQIFSSMVRLIQLNIIELALRLARLRAIFNIGTEHIVLLITISRRCLFLHSFIDFLSLALEHESFRFVHFNEVLCWFHALGLAASGNGGGWLLEALIVIFEVNAT